MISEAVMITVEAEGDESDPASWMACLGTVTRSLS